MTDSIDVRTPTLPVDAPSSGPHDVSGDGRPNGTAPHGAGSRTAARRTTGAAARSAGADAPRTADIPRPGPARGARAVEREELVVLLDVFGRPSGTVPKADVH